MNENQTKHVAPKIDKKEAKAPAEVKVRGKPKPPGDGGVLQQLREDNARE